MELERSQESFDIPKLSPRYPISYNALTTAFKEAQKQHQSKATKAFDFLNYYLSKILESKFKIGWGNRLQRQINDYIPVVIAAGGSLTEATDHILATKILRKVRDRHDIQPGDLTELKETIETDWSELWVTSAFIGVDLRLQTSDISQSSVLCFALYWDCFLKIIRFNFSPQMNANKRR
jgi:hypothetical protein